MNVTGFRVLVAEDEQTFGLTVTRFLQKAGHEVKICTNGKSVLKALDSAEWDVLLLDLKLPDADGVDILARVRKEHPELQTIMLPTTAGPLRAMQFLHEPRRLFQFTDCTFRMIAKQFARLGQHHLASEPVR
jgi:DNA-binding NtrC family response regulator